MDEVEGSSPFSSTQNGHLDLRLGHFLGGFVAGEGWFPVNRRLPPSSDQHARRGIATGPPGRHDSVRRAVSASLSEAPPIRIVAASAGVLRLATPRAQGSVELLRSGLRTAGARPRTVPDALRPCNRLLRRWPR